MAVHAAFGNVETVWVSDIEPGPCKVLAHRYPDVPNITRNEALRALGNGVVPQQGEVALAHLLNIWKETRNVATQDQ